MEDFSTTTEKVVHKRCFLGGKYYVEGNTMTVKENGRAAYTYEVVSVMSHNPNRKPGQDEFIKINLPVRFLGNLIAALESLKINDPL